MKKPQRAVLQRAALMLAGTGALMLGIAPAQARITRIVITSSTPAYGGQVFGNVGAYQVLSGTAYGEVDPTNPLNAGIQDINLAPGASNGRVSYSMDVQILTPVNPAKGNGVLLYDVVNRGSQIAPGFLNVGVTANAPAGDGFLENQGYTLVWSGWQGDLVKTPTNFKAYAPVAGDPNNPITGIVRSEISMLTAPTPGSPILGGFSAASVGYPPVSFDTKKATLTQRVHESDPRQPIASSDWTYATCNATTPFPGTPDTYGMTQYQVCLKGGFSPNYIYELIYEAKEPLVLGLGFAATRDLISYLHHDQGSGNPLSGAVSYTQMFGVSQSGRFVRSFLDGGFNEDENNKIVFDGAQAHIAAGRVALNIRFGQPGRVTGLQHTEHEYPGGETPVTWTTYTDPLTQIRGSVLQRCQDEHLCPKVVQTVSDIEYWESAMSDDTTDSYGRTDLTIPQNVRIYHLASTQHGGYSPIGPVPPPATPVCQQLPNANSYTYNLRATVVALTNWIKDGTQPPKSAYARLSDQTLVRAEELNFPTLPNADEEVGELLAQRSLYYRGPQFSVRNVSGIITVEPPVPVANYTVLVPQTDSNGNDIDGVHSLTLLAPLGTYTGWNVRAAGFGEGDACDLTGSFYPFAATNAQKAAGDPRPSLQALYKTQHGYAAAVEAAATQLVKQGFMLPTDKDAAVADAITQAAPSLQSLPQ